MLPGLWEEGREAEGSAAGGVLGNSSFSEHCRPSLPSLPFPSSSRKKFEVERVPRWNIFQMSVQSVVHYSERGHPVPGSECQRTGRGRATNSRLAGGTSAPLSWESILAGEGTGPTLGSVGRDCGPLWGTHNGPERALCVLCALVFLCPYTFPLSLCWWVRAQTLWQGVSEHRLRSAYMCPPSPRVTMSVCAHTLVELLE